MSEFFHYLHNQEKFFKQHGTKVVFKKGQYLIRSDEKFRSMYFLEKGVVKIGFSFNDGTQRILGYFIPGMVFAQTGAFFEHEPGGLEYIATSDCVTYKIPSDLFLSEIKSNALLSDEYIDFLLQNRIFLIERIVYQGENRIRGKFLKWLVFMAKYYGKTVDDGTQIYIPLTQDEIANFLHATRESISVLCREFTRKKMIRVDHKIITVLDTAKIEEELYG